MVVLLVVGLIIAISAGAFDRASNPDDGDQADAVAACEDFVSDRLTSPGSAEFQRADSANVAKVADEYTYTGFVDSQNTFGALLRTDFTCTVRHIEGDTYELVDVSLRE